MAPSAMMMMLSRDPLLRVWRDGEENSHRGLAKTHRWPSLSILPPATRCWLLPGGAAQVLGGQAPEPALPLARKGWICARLSAPFHRDNGGSSRSFAGARQRPRGSARVPAGTLWGEKGDGIVGPPRLTSPSLSHMRSSQPSSGGDSGMKSQSAPEAKPDTSARYLGGTRRWQHQSRNVASRPTDGLPHA